jgi:uncharacterized membrane protein YebE (DUF533 family)
MATNPILSRDVYLALAAVGWADGVLDPEEADAIVRAALEEGLSLDELKEIEAATKNPPDIHTIDRLTMSKADRLYVYAVASWITRLDGIITEEEEKALEKLGGVLGVPETPRKRADDVVEEIRQLPGGDRPSRFDLVALRRTIEERLAAAQAAREAKEKDGG